MSNEQSVLLNVDGIPGLICTTTASGETEFVNQRLREYLGKTLVEMRSWTIFGAVHPEDRHNSMETWKQSLKTGEPYEVEQRLLDANLKYRWFDVIGVPDRDAEGRTIRWTILLTDIEGRKEAEEQ